MTTRTLAVFLTLAFSAFPLVEVVEASCEAWSDFLTTAAGADILVIAEVTAAPTDGAQSTFMKLTVRKNLSDSKKGRRLRAFDLAVSTSVLGASARPGTWWALVLVQDGIPESMPNVFVLPFCADAAVRVAAHAGDSGESVESLVKRIKAARARLVRSQYP